MAMGNGGVLQERTLAGASQLILSTELSGVVSSLALLHFDRGGSAFLLRLPSFRSGSFAYYHKNLKLEAGKKIIDTRKRNKETQPCRSG